MILDQLWKVVPMVIDLRYIFGLVLTRPPSVPLLFVSHGQAGLASFDQKLIAQP